MTTREFDRLFDGPALPLDAAPGQREMDLARSVQEVTEEIVLRVGRHAGDLTGESVACMAGGVALNCVANRRLLDEGPFEEIWVQPAAGDAGGALGAALRGWYRLSGCDRPADGAGDGMRGAFLGPAFDPDEVQAWLDGGDRPFERIADSGARAERIADLLVSGSVVARCSGRMEFGPRALGNRSILADARDPLIRDHLNREVKGRENFRPFAPIVLAERAAEWFDLSVDSPYMTLVAPVLQHRQSMIPATTHVDGTARVQTVHRRLHPELHAILTAFERKTECPVLVNTSLNVRGEPMACTPDDAYGCFLASGIDHLVIEEFLLDRSRQPAGGDEAGNREFPPD